MIARARLVLVASIVLAVVIVGTRVPLGQLSAENGAMAKYSAELSRLQSENRAIAAQVRALGTDSEIATLAHGEYGLIHPGQRALVIFPSTAVPGAGRAPLATSQLSQDQIVPSDLDTGPPVTSGGTNGDGSGPGSVFEKVMQRLEFWRWAF